MRLILSALAAIILLGGVTKATAGAMQLPELVLQELTRDGPYSTASLSVTNTTSEPLEYYVTSSGAPVVDLVARSSPLSRQKSPSYFGEHITEYDGSVQTVAELRPNQTMSISVKFRPDILAAKVMLTFSTIAPEKKLLISSDQIVIQPESPTLEATYDLMSRLTFDNLKFTDTKFADVLAELNNRLPKNANGQPAIKFFISPLLPKEMKESRISYHPKQRISFLDVLHALNEITVTSYQIDNEQVVILPWR